MPTLDNIKKSKERNMKQLDLYRDPNFQFKYWESSLFNESYLRNELQAKHHKLWNDESKGFKDFFETLRTLFHAYQDHEDGMNGWSEDSTIDGWVLDVLTALGWNDTAEGPRKPYLRQTGFSCDGKAYRTDLLFVDLPTEVNEINKKSGDLKLDEARRSVKMPVEVKYWNRLEQFRQGKSEEKKRLDKKRKKDEFSKVLTPNEQTVGYMNMLKQDWAILTDGVRWRIFNKELSSEEPNRFFEFNLYSLFQSYTTEETEADQHEVQEAAKYFYHFFSKSSLYPNGETSDSFPAKVIEYSKKNIFHVEENLKERFIGAMNFACNEFYELSKKENVGAGINIHLDFVRTVSESCLFNILFIKSLESRGVLPMNTPDYRDLSLSSIIDKIDQYDPNQDGGINLRNLKRAFGKSNNKSFAYKPDGHQLHDKILRLTKIIHDGSSEHDDFGFEISGFKESVFEKKEWTFFTKNKLKNSTWVSILFQLGYTESDVRGRKHQQIPYAYFTPRQLGSIYEGFLEYKLEKADQDMVWDCVKLKHQKKKELQWHAADLSSKYKNTKLPKVKKNQLFFTPNNEDRKESGSYYTPDYVVRYIVEETLSSLVKSKSSDEILKIKVCDPAMGSGHFLVAALNYLTAAYLKALNLESSDELTITQPEAKRRVLNSCIYGVDLNPRAVKLAAMSLWLESAFTRQKLEHLNTQLACGNSLVSEKNKFDLKQFDFPKFFDFKKRGKFDAIVMNPPYISEFKNEEKKYYFERYKTRDRELDTYTLFLERAGELIALGGKIGQITPNTFFLQVSFKGFRKFIIDRFKICQLIDLGDSIFKGVCVPTAIQVFQNTKSRNYKVKTQTKVDFKLRGLGPKNEVGIDSFSENELYEFNLESGLKTLMSCIEKNTLPLSHYLSSHEGVHSGNIRTKLFSEGEKPKSKHAKKMLKGRDFDEFNIDWKSRWVTYDKSLIKKDLGEYASLRDESIFTKPKLITRQTADRIVAHYDENQFYTDNSVHCSWVKESFENLDDLKTIKALRCILNSELIEFYYKYKVQEGGRAFPQVKIVNLRSLPVASGLEFKILMEIIELSGSPIKYRANRPRIDDLIYEFYGVNKSHIKQIRDWLKAVNSVSQQKAA